MAVTLEKIFSLCKRRGFIFPSSEIYGGFASCYDYGPLGVEMKNNIKKLWWDEMTKNKDNIVGLDSSILMSPQVWEASGHLSAGFADELVECKLCHKRMRIDETKRKRCNFCGGEVTEPRRFNLMMKTFVGPVEDKASLTYLRAETCQGIYLNFENVLSSMRMKLPFGICQIGKAFRNEITPRDFLFRMREFEQMEMQWFCEPDKADEFFEFWLKERLNWLYEIGLKRSEIRIKEVPAHERAHYAKRQIDIEFKFPFGWKEIEGIHNRGDWDLSNHSKHSKKDLKYLDPITGKRFFPYIIETSIGVDRLFFALMCSGYTEIKGGRTKTTQSKKDFETVLALDPKVAPVKVAVFPLVRNKPQLVERAKEIFSLVKKFFTAQYDEVDSIGRRYRRQDEIGTPFCVTVDFDTIRSNTVTIRNRDTMEQERIHQDEIIGFIMKRLLGMKP